MGKTAGLPGGVLRFTAHHTFARLAACLPPPLPREIGYRFKEAKAI